MIMGILVWGIIIYFFISWLKNKAKYLEDTKKDIKNYKSVKNKKDEKSSKYSGVECIRKNSRGTKIRETYINNNEAIKILEDIDVFGDIYEESEKFIVNAGQEDSGELEGLEENKEELEQFILENNLNNPEISESIRQMMINSKKNQIRLDREYYENLMNSHKVEGNKDCSGDRYDDGLKKAEKGFSRSRMG